jgi:hypothetical protein
MLRAFVLALMCLLPACVTGPKSQPSQLPERSEPGPSPSDRIELVSTSTDSRLEPSRIRRANLDEARALLSEARTELEPSQWALLDGKLAAAEEAWKRFEALARASGRAAEIGRGAEGLAEAGRVGEASKNIRTLPRIGPLLVLLALLWPSKTAGPEYDEMPPWLDAQLEAEARLRDVAQASEQVRAEIEATRRTGGKRPKTRQPEFSGPQEVEILDEEEQPQGQPPGDPPCIHIETRGSGAFRNVNEPPGEIRCRYKCGRVKFFLWVWGNSDADCVTPGQLARAQREAAQIRARKPQGR